MIPYDDLVAALSSWRARQGLPVNMVGNTGSGPHAKQGSGPNRAPPAPPSASRPGMPVAAEADEVAEVLEEEAYENEGADYGMQFDANANNEVEPTSIGQAPERPTEMDMGEDRGRDDW